MVLLLLAAALAAMVMLPSFSFFTCFCCAQERWLFFLS
jgi:hypothetical protein